MILYKNTGNGSIAVQEQKFYGTCHVLFLAGIDQCSSKASPGSPPVTRKNFLQAACLHSK